MDQVETERRGRAGALALLTGLGALVLPATRAAAATCSATGPADPKAEDQAIREVIARMEAAWNRSDFRGYMEGFLNPGVIFVSGGKIQQDWQGTLDHYIRDYGKPGMRGDLHFSEITIEFLAPDAAQLISHYHLHREVKSQVGINTRLMRKVGGRWVIALNHVSAQDPPPPGA